MGATADPALLDLREFFRDTLAKRIEALRETLAGELAPGSDAEKELRRIAHGIRGSGGIYGYPELSRLGEAAELAPVDSLREHGEALLAELVRRTVEPDDAPSRVLLIEPDEATACDLMRALAMPARAVLHVRSAGDAEALIYDDSFQLVVLRIEPRDEGARGLLETLGRQLRTVAVPVFALTSAEDPGFLADCLRSGAQQVFRPEVPAEVLDAAATAAIERAEATHRNSTVDPLTGLPNRAGFRATVQHAASICARSKEPLSLSILDLDRFKSINDTYGHLVGDEVLRRVAAVLEERTRNSDYAARWGGEEFVVLFYGSRPQGAALALERILGHVKDERFGAPDGTEFRVSFSAGVAEMASGMSTDDAIAEADRLLYHAKRAGRNRIVDPDTVVVSAPVRVLLVEDDSLVATAVERVLAERGYEVLHRTAADAALEAVDRHEIALGILDVNIPGMDGFELLSRFRRLPKLRETPFIMLTGRGAERDIVRGFELGADDYVVKPFSAPTLVARVDRLARRA